MALTIPVAHDFICPWCWVGLLQAKQLQKEFDIQFDWRGYELWPEELEWPEPQPVVAPPANRPVTPTRLEFLLHAEGIDMPKAERPKRMRTHNAHEAVEYAKTEGNVEPFLEALYRAYWEEGLEINSLKVLKKIGKKHLEDADAMLKAIEKRKFAHKIIGFDDAAYANGVYNVPTFFIGDERYSEQPTKVLRDAIQAALGHGSWASIYRKLEFPPALADRPTTFINMVSTIDGKILTGERDEPVMDLGSKIDHKLMARIESQADAVLIGGNTLRASPANWNPRPKIRVVVSASGNLPAECAFLNNGEPLIATTEKSKFVAPGKAKLLRVGKAELDFVGLLKSLRERGVERLYVLGGSEINAELLQRELVDELFLTLAPKIKLGRDVPTYADGEALPRERVQQFRLVENHRVADELFLRYRRNRG